MGRVLQALADTGREPNASPEKPAGPPLFADDSPVVRYRALRHHGHAEVCMRFPMLLSPTWRWLLALLGATPERSYVEVDVDALEVRFGSFWQQLPFREVTRVVIHARTVPWYRYAIGWRVNLRGGVALVGAAENLVKIELGTARRVSLMGISTTMRELYVSLQDPDAFVRAVLPHIG